MSSSGQTESHHHHERHDDRDQARDLERVTDYIEESEINVESVSNVMSLFEKEEQVKQASNAAREKEMRNIKVDKADVKLIAQQMDVDADFAERILKEHGGDPVAALKHLVHRRHLF